MKMQRKAAMVAATLFLAAATGHVVQNGVPLAGGATTTAGLGGVPSGITPVVATVGSAASLPRLPATAAFLPTQPVALATRVSLSEPTAPAPAAPDATLTACDPILAVAAAPAAMLRAHLDAPCRANERVVIRHAGLVVTGRTDAEGALSLDLPAFATEAELTVVFTGGETVSATAAVPDLAEYHRVAVQWQGRDAFQLHALEFGASVGEPGHVSAAVPRAPGAAATGSGGFLTELGDSDVALPMLAEVYSFPAGITARDGTVRLQIEAVVTADTCNREMLAETLDLRGDARVLRTDLSLAMPACEAEGQFLVLKNLLPDMKIALD